MRLLTGGVLAGVLLPVLAGCGAPPAAPVARGGTCRARDGLPDPTCTPGETDRRVTPQSLGSTICRRGYAASVRPPRELTYRLKVRTAQEYGLAAVPFARLELDHLIPLSLGGASTQANLWPELRTGPRGAAAKDVVEVRLHEQVCAGRTGLRQAQRAIAGDWTRSP